MSEPEGKGTKTSAWRGIHPALRALILVSGLVLLVGVVGTLLLAGFCMSLSSGI